MLTYTGETSIYSYCVTYFEQKHSQSLVKLINKNQTILKSANFKIVAQCVKQRI